jgi:hypothetical protein
MKGDFTRDTFDPANHFSRVLMQQGRVQLDADWNEQASILLHYLQALAADLIGPFGGPALHCGFALTAKDTDFTIGMGHYYVDGILIENGRDWTYFHQPDYPLLPESKLSSKMYLAYLDIWERHITALEESAIREVALGGPDTATRAKVVWQLKVTDKQPDGKSDLPAVLQPKDVVKRWPDWTQAWNAQAACQLRVRLQPAQTDTDPCTMPPTSAYRGQENQLYRVEIHAGGTLKDDQPTFKWSRDNGSNVAAWLGKTEDGGLIVSNAYGFAAGQWIEITGDADDLLGQPGKFNRIVRVEGDALYLAENEAFDKKTPKKVRRWDQNETEDIRLKHGAMPITEAHWIDLENGIQVQFLPGGAYRTGDYWLIPARAATGTIEWSGDARTPFGIVHHYAPVWIVTVAADGTVVLNAGNDLRAKFSAMIK